MKQPYRQLCIDSGAFEYYNINEGIEFDDVPMENYGKTIVLECIDVLKKRYMGDNNREDMEVRRCIEALKSRFGIE